ncbi:MAG TPA: ATP-binding cassette domain-containing protein [Candidatus Bathyarchaeia archaeon]|nr:ATP-binding cassette domain-containing protein [Candidatus Bathyarchaeia archaeon]
MTIVELNNIQYTFTTDNKPISILKDINLLINKGEFHVITGPSGSGKTTLLQLIATFLHPTNGTRTLFDQPISSLSSMEAIYRIREKIGYLFQTPYLPDHITTFEYIKLQAQLSGVQYHTAEERTKEFLTDFGIEQFSKVRPATLSGGEKQRIALAAILAKDIQLLLLDEPTGSLDFESRKNIWAIISKLKNKNLTIIAVTHSESFIKRADYIHKLDYGILEQNK